MSQSKIANIYNNHVDDLYTYALYLGFEKESIMDAIHDVFCRLSENKEMLDDVTNVKFYLFRSLKNRLLDIVKSKKEYVEIDSELEREKMLPFNFHIHVDDEIESKEDRQLIKNQIWLFRSISATLFGSNGATHFSLFRSSERSLAKLIILSVNV